MLLLSLVNVPYLVVPYKVLNKITQEQQMDVLIRYWDAADDSVKTRCLTSRFLGHTCAEGFASAFRKAVQEIKGSKILQVSMDGPNCKEKAHKRPTCSSYKVVEEAVSDQVLSAKLAFALSIAEELEPFLREFQTDKPMVPFLSAALESILRSLLSRIVKREVLDAADTIAKLMKIDSKSSCCDSGFQLELRSCSAKVELIPAAWLGCIRRLCHNNERVTT
ncbi:hypothetical protein HPB49_000157 [Dermacentor silvarum]|uniref:Uncharacterized protein n=1 Tax=Dermacentor silvarum TaxID=543639 RepID=A0ACB8DRY2_DERSI|nr:hypothetical protein HPB49_000157 [Dermacentor silvarum]